MSVARETLSSPPTAWFLLSTTTGNTCAYNVITMRARLVKIGNSRGVRIPKLLLKQAGLEDEIEITLVDGQIRIAAPPEPEQGIALAVLSEQALGDWNREEEDEAWASLQ